MAREFVFSSESVTKGHPDKVADQISDSILDAIIAGDPKARVACETMVTTGMALVGGEITTNVYVDIPKIVRDTIRGIGYNSALLGYDADTCSVLTCIDEQSPDIAMGVDPGGAGDQGLMFGYACTETDVLMPLPITIAHRLVQRLTDIREDGTLDWVRPDGKSQVAVRYVDGKPVSVEKVLVSTQHDDVPYEMIREGMIEHVIRPVLAEFSQKVPEGESGVQVNPTGKFIVGGPQGDCGLTGRKIIVDTYGGSAPHGGGAFSGKDPTKVDRSACYAARHVAKNIVAAGFADRCQVQLAYAIGIAEPFSLAVDTFGTGSIDDQRLTEAVAKVFDLTPGGIITSLDLQRPIYKQTACNGHFGHEQPEFTWEKTDRVEDLKRFLG